MIYLMLACCQKMYRRVTTWHALGTIRNLATVDRDRLEAVLKNSTLPDDMPIPDSHLARWLGSKDMSQERFNVLMESAQEWTSKLSSPSLSSLQAAAAYSDGTGIYRKDTFLDFHFLCVRLLIIFARGLKSLQKAYKHQQHIKMPKMAEATIAVARALLTIAHSPSLKLHLETLSSYQDTLPVPTASNEQAYNAFALEYGIIASPPKKKVRVKTVKAKVKNRGLQLPPLTAPDGFRRAKVPVDGTDGNLEGANSGGGIDAPDDRRQVPQLPPPTAPDGFQRTKLVAPVDGTDEDLEGANSGGSVDASDDRRQVPQQVPLAAPGSFRGATPVALVDDARAGLEAANNDGGVDAPGDDGMNMGFSVEDDGERGEEGIEVMESVMLGSAAATYRILIKTFVGHFAAKRALERHSSKRFSKGEDVDIRVLGTCRSTTDPGSWKIITDLVYELEAENHLKKGLTVLEAKALAEDHISKLEDHIMAFDATSDVVKEQYHKVYRQVSHLHARHKATPEKPVPFLSWLSLFCGGLHCEAILAALSKYYHLLGMDDDPILKKIVQV